MEKTLREVCKDLHVTRRAVQGYENAGLVSPSGRNSRGYLLYDEMAMKRIKQVKMYQDMGFPIKEITHIIDGPKEELRQMLYQKVGKLREQKEKLETVIHMAEEMIAQL